MKRVSRRVLLRALPKDLASLLERIVAVADELDLALHAVGGPVRDLLLDLPLRDVDLLVEGAGAGGAAALAARLGGLGRPVPHDRFGTVRLETPHGDVDLASCRRETYPHPGALPEVAPGTLEEDLRRRDFTVNALALPLSHAATRSHPPLVDVAGGVEDLTARRLRVFHGRSFHDDPTRALRAARLAARLSFRVARTSRAALRAALREGAFGRVSGERLRREIEKLFADAGLEQDPARALRLLADWHVLAALEPGLVLAAEASAPLRRLGRSLREPPWRIGAVRPWVPGLSLWLAPLPAALRRRALARFAWRGDLARRVSRFPESRDRILRGVARARGRGAIDRLLGELDDESLLALHASAPPALRRRIVRYAREDRERATPVDGHDLLALGLAGPQVGRTLARIRAATLDGRVRGREEALALAREIARRVGAGARGS